MVILLFVDTNLQFPRSASRCVCVPVSHRSDATSEWCLYRKLFLLDLEAVSSDQRLFLLDLEAASFDREVFLPVSISQKYEPPEVGESSSVLPEWLSELT